MSDRTDSLSDPSERPVPIESPPPPIKARYFQCPGCWSITMGAEPEGGWLECDCGEALTCIDLREHDPAECERIVWKLGKQFGEAEARAASLEAALRPFLAARGLSGRMNDEYVRVRCSELFMLQQAVEDK